MMKKLWIGILGAFLAGWTQANVLIDQVNLEGRVSDTELALKMNFEARVDQSPSRIKVLNGAVAPTSISLPRGAKMVKQDGAYYIDFSKKGTQSIALDFEVKVVESGQKRSAVFDVPAATIRKITLQTGREGRNVEIDNAPRMQKLDADRVQTFLSSSGAVYMHWSPELEKLSGELVASCDTVFIGSAKVGALQFQGQFSYNIPQGRMKNLTMKLPDGLNVIQVNGADLLAWDLRREGGSRQLFVELSRPQEKSYLLTVQAEQSLAEFPCSFDFPMMEPQGVIRASGVVLVGTDSTLKLLVDELSGMTQVEPGAVSRGDLIPPKRSLYAYMFANMPFKMKLSADNIVTSLHAQDQLVLSLSEKDAALDAKVDLEVRDAPVRDVEFKISTGWTAASVTGKNVADYDVRDRDGFRWIKVYFKTEVASRTLIQIRLENTLSDDTSGFEMPVFQLTGAKSERGFLVLRGETGTRLEGADLKELREVNTGSLPVKISDARQAFRFKRPDWSGRVQVRLEKASIHGESFQLISLGESGVFGSSLITYNIANAPVRSFDLQIPAACRNVEVHGRDIRNWTQDGERWTVYLQQKVIGDYTLLVTYDHAAKYQGEELSVGGVQALDVDHEAGYIALAGAANLSLGGEVGYSPTILPIDVDEVPGEYASLVNDPVMHAYKYTAAPHIATVQIKSFDTQQLLTQVVDHTTLNTTISKDGEAVTMAVYHVKNTDRQYLPIRLPEGASLWSVKVDDKKIQVLDRGDGQVLVPVERRRDPNAPLKVEVTYAQQLNKPGMMARMNFQSPVVDTPSVFSRWTFKLPSGKRLASAKGNMEISNAFSCRRPNWGRLWAEARSGKGWVWGLMSLLLGSGLFLIGKRVGAGQSGLFVFSMIIIYSLIAAAVLGVMTLGASSVLSGVFGRVPTEWLFNKAVSGSDGGLMVRLTLVNAHYGLLKNTGIFFVGIIPVIWMLVSGRRKYMTLRVVFLAGLFSFIPVLAWITFVLPQLLFFIICLKTGLRKGNERRNIIEARKSLNAQAEFAASGKEGFVPAKLLVMLGGFLLVAAGGAAMLPGPRSAEDLPVVEEVRLHAKSVALRVTVPEFEAESRVNVSVSMELELTAEKGDRFELLGPGFILKEYDLPSRHLTVSADENGSVLQIRKDGTYKFSVQYLVPAVYADGEWSAALWVPDALKNQAQVQLPTHEWTLKSANAVRIQQDGSSAYILFGPDSRLCKLRWTPEERKTDLEASRFFCDVNTLARFRPGMVSLQHNVILNIAQGELQELRFDVPENMSITEVRGKNIGTWRYDPKTGVLDVVLSAPASGSYQLQVGAQAARKKLPYDAGIKGITVRDAAMQRGVVAIASSPDVQVDMGPAAGLSGINIADASRLFPGISEASIKRAFRYNQMPFSASVSADQVLPELRLQEETSLDLSSEQVRLSCRLNVTVSKSGIFALRIRIPAGFDVDSLSGERVSHWDEVNTENRELVVNFARQVTGTIPLNLVLSRSGRDLEREFQVPRIRMDGVLKHTGQLAITVERGIRITPVSRDGVSEISPRELGIRQEGSLAYRLLRPDWTVELGAEVMDPKIKAEVLQRVSLTEGQMNVRCYVQYDIEHAGVKSFRLQPPRADLALVVSGRNISRVRKVDDLKGIWEVELHGKVDDRYGMEVSYQLPFAHDLSELQLQPLQTIGTESQKGFITVLSNGRLQIEPTVVSDFLRSEDARSIPRRFGAGDLSDAVLCYRTTERNFELKLNVVRHNAADVLPAQVRSVQLDSIITKEDRSLNNMTMLLDPGSLRFLEMRLPEDSTIWSVFVNETAVRPLVEDGVYLIPIEPGADLSASVNVMYAQAAQASLLGTKHVFSGPQFKLPLSDVLWTFYAPEGAFYNRFGGTMQHQRFTGSWSRFSSFGEKQYAEFNVDEAQRFGDSAKLNIVEGNKYMKSGDQRSARKAFQKAISYSQGQQALNEDARVQFRNLVRQQGVVGLVNRRNQLKQSLNQLDEDLSAGGGNEQWSGADVHKIEAQLGEKESSSLSSLAEKMLDQQQAASVDVHPLRVVMAKNGTQLQFKRTLQLKPDTEMTVEFHSVQKEGGRMVQVVAVALSAGLIFLFSAWLKKDRDRV